MRAEQFVAGTCGWDPVAPLELRREALASASGWKSYSTARFLSGLNETRLMGRGNNPPARSVSSPPIVPGVCTTRRGGGARDEPLDSTVLYATETTGAPFNSTMSVELLPSPLARRWQSIGLRFATEGDMDDLRFMEALAKSLDLIRLVPPLHGTLAGMCRSLHVLLASDRHFDVSYSDPSVPFTIFVSCPRVKENNRVERLAENIIHEALHLQLSLVERVEPLVVDGTENEPVLSPWKEGERTLPGLLHAAYVFSNLRCFWKRVAIAHPNSSSFARKRVEVIDQEIYSARHLVDSPSLTATGRSLATGVLQGTGMHKPPLGSQ